MNDTFAPQKKKIIAHSGGFHADEVFACAVLSLVEGGNVEIVRSRDPLVWETGDYVVDVGGVYDHARRRYDHHQEGGAGARENGVPYSSLGLVWKHYGEQVAGSVFAARMIDKQLVQPVDLGDNGIETFSVSGNVAPYLLQDVINVFRAAWDENRTEDEGFFEAFELAKKVLEREIILAKSEESGRKKVEEAYASADDKRIIVLDGHYPWFEVIASHTEPVYVIKPDRGNRGQWKVECVRDDMHTFRNRKALPASWAGKRDHELADASGVSDAVFCHNKLFVAIAGSKEGAIALAKKALAA